MKKLRTNIILILCTLAVHAQYDQKLVTISSVDIGNEQISYVAMSREGSHIKAKYFAAFDMTTGKTVYQRFLEWSKNKKLVAITSGGYMSRSCDGSDPRNTPVGLCIDNGIVVNKNLSYNQIDGLVLVYPSGGGGGIALSNLKTGDFNIQDSGKYYSINIRDGYAFNSRFMPWAMSNNVSVFQSHLFVYKNNFLLDSNKASPRMANRRFLAVGTNPAGQVSHYIVNLPYPQSIYHAAFKTFAFLQKRSGINVSFMINLETGCQDVFQVYKADGSLDLKLTGTISLSYAGSLLCYYYE